MINFKVFANHHWPPTPVFLPGEFQGHRSLASFSPWGRKELDTTEQLTNILHAESPPSVVQSRETLFLVAKAHLL